MKTIWRVALGCAAAGFVIPLVMLAYYSVTNSGAGELYLVLCPVCIASMGLDHATTSTAVVAWLIFCVINAVLYAIPGLLAAVVLNFRHRQ